MTPIRLPDWRSRLDDMLVRHTVMAFSPGLHDCALFAASCVAAMTGVDPAARWRGQYATIEEGLRAVRADGFRTPEAVFAALFEPVAPALAQVGDIAVLAEVDGLAPLGIMLGEVIGVLRPEGLGWVSRMQAVAAYRVP
jgi:hypothetical protein